MTIRQQIAKRAKRAMGLAFGAWLLFAVFGVIWAQELDNPLFGFAAFAVFGGAALYMRLFITRPRCGFRFGQAGMSMAFRSSGAQSINFCAHCGVKLYEEL